MKTYVVNADLLQAVLNTLAKMPYHEVNGLINEILKLNEQHPAEEQKEEVLEGVVENDKGN